MRRIYHNIIDPGKVLFLLAVSLFLLTFLNSKAGINCDSNYTYHTHSPEVITALTVKTHSESKKNSHSTRHSIKAEESHVDELVNGDPQEGEGDSFSNMPKSFIFTTSTVFLLSKAHIYGPLYVLFHSWRSHIV